MPDKRSNLETLREALDRFADPARRSSYFDLYAEDVVLHGYQGISPGLASVKAYYQAFWSAFPDARVTVEDLVEQDDKIALRFVITGTHRGTVLDIPATGRAVSLSRNDRPSISLRKMCGTLECRGFAFLAGSTEIGVSMIKSRLNFRIWPCGFRKSASLRTLTLGLLALGTMIPIANAQETPASSVPETNSSFIDANGTAHITRVVPVPATISPEAQKALARPVSDAAVPETLAERRSKADASQARNGEICRKLYPVKDITNSTMAGVPVKVITPIEIPEEKRGRVLINVHGGGFTADSGSMTETIPIANLTQTKVIAILYRLAPEHPFPAAVDDTVAVYRELLKTYKPKNIGLYGTSAGAILTAEVAVKIKQLGLPLPAALGIFSGKGDYSTTEDSANLFALSGLSGHMDLPQANPRPDPYAASTNLTDPVLSPLFADLKGLPPALFLTSTRDLHLSGTTILHRKFLSDGVDARLVVFEALPHAFWNNPNLPESKEADGIIASFFDKEVGK
jgi:epsilon-lactone hydrolase